MDPEQGQGGGTEPGCLAVVASHSHRMRGPSLWSSAHVLLSSANHGTNNKTLARPLRAPVPLHPRPHCPQLPQGPQPPDCPVSGMLPWPFLQPRVFFPVRVTALISPPPGSPHWPPTGLSSPFLVSEICLVLCAHSCPGTRQALRNLKEETRVLLGVTDVWGCLGLLQSPFPRPPPTAAL